MREGMRYSAGKGRRGLCKEDEEGYHGDIGMWAFVYVALHSLYLLSFQNAFAELRSGTVGVTVECAKRYDDEIHITRCV